MLDFNIQHVLILAILICILYLLLNNTICNTKCNIDGFSVGGRKIRKKKRKHKLEKQINKLKKELHELRKKNKFKKQIKVLEEQIKILEYELSTEINALEYQLQNETDPEPTHCDIGESVLCPGSTGVFCSGNQCCPDGTRCPSAPHTFNGCPKGKLIDCTKVKQPCTNDDCNDRGIASGYRPECECKCDSGWSGSMCTILPPPPPDPCTHAIPLTPDITRIEPGQTYILDKDTKITKSFINEGTLCIPGETRLSIYDTFKNKNKIYNHGFISNEGTITNNSSGATINNSRSIYNIGSIYNSSGATINNNQDFFNYDGGEIINSSGATINNRWMQSDKGATITNNGLFNNRELINCGDFKGSGKVTNSISICSKNLDSNENILNNYDGDEKRVKICSRSVCP
tara:strand:+ start:84 stop:1289 length:1206 start_codon:yes stop_codon:yes gene_type:complete